MKKIFLTFLMSAFIWAGCSDDESNENSSIKVSDPQELEQELYADTPESGFTFSATGPWIAQVTETANARSAAKDEVYWIKLSSYGGEAGTYTLSITLETNRTGEDRHAKIEIICGGDKITIYISQSGETEDGKLPDESVAVTAISLNESSLELTVGDKYTFVATIAPENATDKSVSWKSSNESLVTINEMTGEVTAVAQGTATITATVVSDNAKTASCVINVTEEIIGTTGEYVTKINGIQVQYDENNNVIGFGDEMYGYPYIIKGSHLGGGGPLIYIDRENEDWRYDYVVSDYVNEIRYYPSIYVDRYFFVDYSWDNGNLVSVRGDQAGVSREGYLRTTFEYNTEEYALGNLNITFLLASQEYRTGFMLAAFDNNVGKHSRNLISRATQIDEDGDKYDATRTYRYVFNENGYIKEIYCTTKYKYEDIREEELIYSFEY